MRDLPHSIEAEKAPLPEPAVGPVDAQCQPVPNDLTILATIGRRGAHLARNDSESVWITHFE